MKNYLLLIFCLLLLSPACRAMPKLDDTQTETDGLKTVAAYWVKLLDEGKLPGMAKDDHGSMSGYRLSKEAQKNLLDTKIIDKNMLADVKDCKAPYIMYVETTDKRYLKYFFNLEPSKVSLISSYHYTNGAWVKY